jgi:hypothetical protein
VRRQGAGGRQLLNLDAPAGPDQPEAVGQKLAIDVEQPGAQPRLIDQPANDGTGGLGGKPLLAGRPDGDGGGAERAREQLALRAQRIQLRGDQLGAVFAQIEQAADRDQQRQDVERQDAAREREARPPRLARRRLRRSGRFVDRFSAPALGDEARFDAASACALAPVANGRGSDSPLRTRSLSRQNPSRPT